jgi:hypothetical protein
LNDIFDELICLLLPFGLRLSVEGIFGRLATLVSWGGLVDGLGLLRSLQDS